MGVMGRVLLLVVFATPGPCCQWSCWWLFGGLVAAQPESRPADASVSRELTGGRTVDCLWIDCLAERLDNSWVAELNEDPEAYEHAPNKKAREVRSGHFVLVSPTPLPQPVLVATSREMAQELGLAEVALQDRKAIQLLSGDVSAVPGFNVTWATPYALSIYGKKVVPGGSGLDGDGYGDGRAISIGEIVVAAQDPSVSRRWELQLKGGGRTPFARTADGRAVLRSSVREFLASEAMHHLRVPTTRALSLVVSRTEKSRRPWYSNKTAEFNDRTADLSHTPPAPPDIVQMEPCAITARVSSSFLRVGHFELYARRARGDRGAALVDTGLEELRALALHALSREFPEQLTAADSIGSDVTSAERFQAQILGMARAAAERFAQLAANWVRVGYVQSNFNADNCLINGGTVDYGPFGYIEQYDPGWGMWISSGNHFAFMNQPRAMGKNLEMFLVSLEPLLDAAGVEELRSIVQGYDDLSEEKMRQMLCDKLGLNSWERSAKPLWMQLEPMMRQSAVDWTIMWRQLAVVLDQHQQHQGRAGVSGKEEVDSLPDWKVLEPLQHAFYRPLTERLQQQWVGWVRRWLFQLDEEGSNAGASADDALMQAAKEQHLQRVTARMRLASPKYVPREWMLAEAYSAAAAGDYSVVHRLQDLFRAPYEEQSEFADKYYRRTPESAKGKGGVAFMS